MSGDPRFKENMQKKCRINSRKKGYNKSRTTKQVYFHKYVPTTIITIKVGGKSQVENPPFLTKSFQLHNISSYVSTIFLKF